MSRPLCVHVGPSTRDRWRTCALGLGVAGRCRVLVECAVCPSQPSPPAVAPVAKAAADAACVHRGGPTGERVPCQTCKGVVELKLLACAVHGSCTPGRAVDGVACCDGCPDKRTPFSLA